MSSCVRCFFQGLLTLSGQRGDGLVLEELPGVGRNLFTITNYSGLDPEVSGLFGDPFQVRMDWFQYPQFRTYTAVVEIAF